jgi:hypothetical protein
MMPQFVAVAASSKGVMVNDASVLAAILECAEFPVDKISLRSCMEILLVSTPLSRVSRIQAFAVLFGTFLGVLCYGQMMSVV